MRSFLPANNTGCVSSLCKLKRVPVLADTRRYRNSAEFIWKAEGEDVLKRRLFRLDKAAAAKDIVNKIFYSLQKQKILIDFLAVSVYD